MVRKQRCRRMDNQKASGEIAMTTYGWWLDATGGKLRPSIG
jgi:hypothetical protein